jgi:hypothetical protein
MKLNAVRVEKLTEVLRRTVVCVLTIKCTEKQLQNLLYNIIISLIKQKNVL